MKLHAPLLSFLGFDRSVMLAGVGRAMGIILGPIGSLIVVSKLTVEDQGLYYLFLSLTSLRSFFDLGASSAIAQMAPHMRSENSDVKDGLASPEFIRVASKWMKMVAILFGLICGFFGLCYLQWAGQMTMMIAISWLLTIAATAVSGSLEGGIQIVYGAGHVDAVSKLRITSQIVQYFVQWSLLLLGLNLLSFGIATTCVFLWQRFNLKKLFPVLWRRIATDPVVTCSIRSEMGFLVKKASITYVSGYLVFQVQQPIVFKLLGPEGSAKLGLTSIIGSALMGMAAIWSLTMFPRFAKQVANQNYNEAFVSFQRTWFRSAAVALVGFGAAFGALALLHLLPQFSERLMSLGDALPLFLALFVQQLALALTFWPRSFKVEPFAPIALIQMVVTPVATWWAVLWFGLPGIGWGNLTSWIIGICGIAWIYSRFLPGKSGFIEAKGGLVK
jgi:hypothetical protein